VGTETGRMSVAAPIELVPGNLYFVTFLRQSGNYRWYQCQTQVVFLGLDRDGHESLWSGRPVFGTSSIPMANITDAKLIAERVGGRGATEKQIKRVKQLPGAVPGPSARRRLLP
jgi:hypothetical protein